MFAAVMAAGCVPNNTVFAPEDAAPEMPDDPDPDPTQEPCEPGAFLGCEEDVAQFCGADGLTIASTSCDAGCNAGAARCNECVPDATTCATGEVVHCGSDGLVASTESCAAGCVDEGGGPRCAHIVPAFLPNVCDAQASLPAFEIDDVVPRSFDTDDNTKCNGGIIKMHPTGPEICVVRARTIALSSPLTVLGSRAIAFVADGELIATSTIDVSARGSASGPGGGVRVSGAAPSTAGGGASGGGAGGKQAGASGGALGDLGLNSGAGGAVSDQFVIGSFEGGARAGSANVLVPNYGPQGGGGGGALMLVSCTDEVIAAGIIDAAGGGGGAGGDGVATAVTKLMGGAGGGAGGYVVLQGANVTASGAMFANGGGGGGGCSGEGCRGKPGEDGNHSRARGGAGTGSGTAGGTGSLGTSPPTNGVTSLSAGSPGGGGGASGRFQIFVPAGVTPSVSTQPAFEPHRTIETR